MIESLREIGRYSLEKAGRSLDNPVEVLVENPGEKGYENLVVLDFSQDQKGDLDFVKVDREKLDKRNPLLYLYRKKGSAGANFTITTIITDSLEKTWKNRIASWAKQSRSGKSDLVSRLAQLIARDEEKILEALGEEHRKNSLENTVFTIKIDEKYLGEQEEFKEDFLNQYREKLEEVSTKKGFCSLCNDQGIVYGGYKPWAFYTLDKPGFIASGFDAKKGWKNFPICERCLVFVDEAKDYVGDRGKLDFRFAGMRYFLLPKSVMGDKEVLKETLEIIEDREKKKISIENFGPLSDDEDEILGIAAEQKDSVLFNFLFYEQAKAKFAIHLYLSDVLPSHIKKIYKAKTKVEKHRFFKEAYKEKGALKNVYFTFSHLRRFLGGKKPFLNCVERIFKFQPLNYRYLLDQMVNYLRSQFVQEYPTKRNTLESWQILMLLEELGIITIPHKGENHMGTSFIDNEVKKKVGAFFGEFRETFSTPAIQAVFLTGVLVEYLLRIQSQERGAAPFRKKLKGLKLSQKDIMGIFPQAQNKLEEYGKNFYRQLEALISEGFLAAGPDWKLTGSEINYYFLLGMNLSDGTTKTGEPLFKAVTETKEEVKK